MQLKQVARDALLRPLQAVSGIVERRHTLPILANVLLEQKDGRLHVTATAPSTRSAAVAAKPTGAPAADVARVVMLAGRVSVGAV